MRRHVRQSPYSTAEMRCLRLHFPPIFALKLALRRSRPDGLGSLSGVHTLEINRMHPGLAETVAWPKPWLGRNRGLAMWLTHYLRWASSGTCILQECSSHNLLGKKDLELQFLSTLHRHENMSSIPIKE